MAITSFTQAASSSMSSSILAHNEPLSPRVIEAQVPEGKEYLFIRGEGRGLHLNRGVALVRIGPNRWVAPLSDSSSNLSLWIDDQEKLDPGLWSHTTCDERIYANDTDNKQLYHDLNAYIPLFEAVEAKQAIWDDEEVAEKIESMKSHHQCSLSQRLPSYPGNIRYITIDNTAIQSIAQPYWALLKKMTTYYKKKYDITIHVITINQFAEKIHQSFNSNQPEGFIITDDLSKLSHVTPLIVQNGNHVKEIVILDSIAHYATYSCAGRLYSTTCEALKHSNYPYRIKIFLSTTPRQADLYSCRTDALIILLNALLDLKKFPTQSLREKLVNTSKYHASMIHPQISTKTCQPPPAWGYTNQISDKRQEARRTLISRDYFSHSKAKRNNPRTGEQFQTQHLQKCVQTTSISLWSLPNFLKLSNQHSLTSKNDCTRCHYNGALFQQAEEKQHNTYLAHKGWKIARKAAELHWNDLDCNYENTPVESKKDIPIEPKTDSTDYIIIESLECVIQ